MLKLPNLQSVTTYHYKTNDLKDDKFYSYDGVLYSIDENGEHHIYSVPKSKKTVNINPNITTIAAGAFADCKNLFKVNIPFGILTIETNAFKGCSSLKEITIPNSVTSIEDYAFENCGLKKIDFGKRINTLGKGVFKDCRFLNNVEFTESIETIGSKLFKGCSALNNFSFNSVIKIIPNEMFAQTGFSQFVFPDSITEIGANVFNECDKLENICIPVTVIKIGEQIATSSNCIISCEATDKPEEWADNFAGEAEVWWEANWKDIKYELDESKEFYIASPNLGNVYKNITLLEKYYNKPVKQIKQNSFYSYSEITNIFISKNIVSIGNQAFDNCTNLKSITIPNSVAFIGRRAFSNCTSVTSITIGTGVQELGTNAFYYCVNLETLYFNAINCTKISSPFIDCGEDAKSLSVIIGKETIRIPAWLFVNVHITETIFEEESSCIDIGELAFSGTKLTNINIPNSVISIGDSAFNISSLEEITVPFIGTKKDGTGLNQFSSIIGGRNSSTPKSLKTVTVTGGSTIYEKAFQNCYYLQNINLPASISSIGEYAFYSCRELINIIIPDNVTSIGQRAFYECNNMVSISVGTKLAEIGEYAFSGCFKLVEVINHSSLNIIAQSDNYGHIAYWAKEVHNSSSKIDNIDNYLFYTYNNINYLLSYTGTNTDLTLPKGYKGENYEIYNYAFFHGTITSVIIPNNITFIGDRVFSNCHELANIIIPNSVTSIGAWAFSGCDSLTSVTIPDSVTSIGGGAFSSCYELAEIIIPNSVTNIGTWAFWNCYKLKKITVNNNNTVYESIDDNLYTKGGKTLICYAAGKSNTNFTIPNTVETIFTGAFAYSKLENIIIPTSVTHIQGSAFEYCENIEEIVIPNSILDLGYEIFISCTKLTRVTIETTQLEFLSILFWDCDSLTTINVAWSKDSPLNENSPWGAPSTADINYNYTSV